MVYKIRNKGFNNFSTSAESFRVWPSKKTKTNVDLAYHVVLQTHITRYSGMRILHNYRNISRASKQFMMGDRFFEKLMILTIKEHFFRPMYYSAPIEQTFFLVRYSNDSSNYFTNIGTNHG